MELYFGETRRIVPQFLACKRRQLELWKDVGIEFHVEIYLITIFFLTYMLSLFMFVVQDRNLF